MRNFISEDNIEQAVLTRLRDRLGYELLWCHTNDPADLNDRSGRTDKRDVILLDRLRVAALRLNPDIPPSVIDEALSQLTDRRATMSLTSANREVDSLIRDGIAVEYPDEHGVKQHKLVRVINFDHPETNQFLAVSQLWVRGERRFRRPDILLYINGLPLVFIELKNSNVKLRSAYDDNLTNYKSDIPQLFLTNAVCILSNGIETKVGSFTAGWEHFFNWLRVDNEKEQIDRAAIQEQGTSLELVVDGLCDRIKLLDYIENFILYHKQTVKIIAQNHQFIGVNNAFTAFKRRGELDGRLGVFWHTQGSGKSFSMIFYVRKIARKLTGNFTFVVVTDREDLNGQIYRNFLNTDAVHKHEAARPANSDELRQFLGQNKRLIFTLIQKFRYDKGRAYPLLSARDDIVIIVDEAHRTQYRSLAENMRQGLPNAQYIAFTGTPLLGADRKTNAWFGDYVSEYNFQQSIEDGATVPLYYQKRVPEVLVQNEELGDEFYAILEDEQLDENQQAILERKFAREVEVIKRDDRLETIALDIVDHFPRRGYLGKGMVISLDKFTAVRMYDKVQRAWKASIQQIMGQIQVTSDKLEKERLKKRLDWMRATQMAVVVSEEAGEEEKFSQQGLDIRPHRRRMNQLDAQGNDIEDNFKNPEHPLRLVFVCAMWLTGFDAPTVSTLYLDKPMKDHTLMQTIARANRVSGFVIDGANKTHGEIIDYYNVFRNMQEALRNYAQGGDGAAPPVQEKVALFALLDDAIAQAQAFCNGVGIDLNVIAASRDLFANISQFQHFADILLSRDDWRKSLYVYDNTINGLYEACKPEILSQQPRPLVAIISYLRGVIDTVLGRTDLDEVTKRIGELLDQSVVVDSHSISEERTTYQLVQEGKVWDLSALVTEQLRAEFAASPHKYIEIADLRVFIERKLERLLSGNVTRISFAERFQSIIDAYNAGSIATERSFEELINFARDLHAEDERHIREGLTEDELELFDILKKENMTQAEEQSVKLAAKALLRRLREEQPRVLVQDWYRHSQSQQAVWSAVRTVLNRTLPESYDKPLFDAKCATIFELMVDFASTGRKWAA